MKQTTLNQKNGNTQIATLKNPMGKIYQLSIGVLMLLLLSLLLFSCSNKKKEPVGSTPQTMVETPQKTNSDITLAQNFEIVPNDKVCMVNDRFMGIPQIAIDVKGTTYYGCCEDCVEKLQKNINDVRFGSNPLSNDKVDKASAVIVQDMNTGIVFYFATNNDALTFMNKNKV